MSSEDELDLVWEEEQIRRRKSYSFLLGEVYVKGYSEQCQEWNGTKIKEWARKFREITGG